MVFWPWTLVSVKIMSIFKAIKSFKVKEILFFFFLSSLLFVEFHFELCKKFVARFSVADAAALIRINSHLNATHSAWLKLQTVLAIGNKQDNKETLKLCSSFFLSKFRLCVTLCDENVLELSCNVSQSQQINLSMFHTTKAFLTNHVSFA